MQNKPNIFQANRCPPCPKNAKAIEKIVYWLGVGLGSGLARRAAGTWGSLGGLLVWLLAWFLIWRFGGGLWLLAALCAAGLVFGSKICGKTSELMGIDDDPHIVFDEWVGVWLALLPCAFALPKLGKDPFGGAFWLTTTAAFGLFRFFDVTKPFPIGWADRKVGGGFGILLDDVLAGILAGVLAWALLVGVIS